MRAYSEDLRLKVLDGVDCGMPREEVAPEELLEVATDSARRSIIGKEQAAEQVERDLERMSRERLLPDEKTLEEGCQIRGPSLQRALQGSARTRGLASETNWRCGSLGPTRRGRIGGEPRAGPSSNCLVDGFSEVCLYMFSEVQLTPL